jgi:hypothetical protein
LDCAGRQHQTQSGAAGQGFRQRLRRVDGGDAVAPALLAGRDGDLAPVAEFFVRALAAEAHFGALGDERPDRGHAEFHRLLHDPVHAFAARNADREFDRERRLAIRRREVAHCDQRERAAAAGERGGEAAAATVEHFKVGAGLKAQHFQQMVAGAGFERDLRAFGQRLIGEYPGTRHGGTQRAAANPMARRMSVVASG